MKMNKSKAGIGIAFALALAIGWQQAGGLWAAPSPTLKGPFQIKANFVHTSGISGQMTLSQANNKVTGVKLDLDKPVFGHSSFPSSEQWSATPGTGSAEQLVVAFRLQGPPHTFYFVFVGTSADGGLTESGSIFRVDAKLADIQAAAAQPLPAQPTGWKEVGNATLKAQ
jgi:hypothetical protein